MKNDTNEMKRQLMVGKTLKSAVQTGDSAQPGPNELCPMPDIAKLIGGKWKLIILQILIFQGTKRFNELRRLCDGVTQTMLTSQLRALEKSGLVKRKVYAEVPPRVEYTATQKAMDLEEMFQAMHSWWLNHS